MGSIGKAGTPVPKTRTEKFVGRIVEEIEAWVADSYMDEYDKESVINWHDLLEQLDMTSAEAKEYITDALSSDYWDAVRSNRNIDMEEALALTFDDDGTFEDENGNFLKYGVVMKLVKQELVKKGILKKPN